MLGGCPLNPGSQAGWQPGSEGVKLMGLVGIFFFPSLLGYLQQTESGWKV